MGIELILSIEGCFVYIVLGEWLGEVVDFCVDFDVDCVIVFFVFVEDFLEGLEVGLCGVWVLFKWIWGMVDIVVLMGDLVFEVVDWLWWFCLIGCFVG